MTLEMTCNSDYSRAMKMEHYRQGVKIRDITNDEIYSYDSPVSYHFEEPIEFLPGDEIKTTCVFRSKNKKKTTFYGRATSDEMCFGFLMYYPQESVTHPYCGSWKSLPSCKIYTHYKDYPVIDKCQWLNMINISHPYTKAIIDGVNNNCVPFGPCTPECIKEVQNIKNHACMNTDIGEYIKSLVLQFKNMDLVDFFTGINSCSAEIARTNQTPCCENC
ncbi:hypothetical protein KUTeg_022341 [Tegillarca granosa]|uniref:Copper type II ascorbate-dependent monooxygenase C-terminal domain-containing protein n=1 Tax=Tegillarca granosa TaxID=220873 RepID=A0ABQ9EB81_TEGGR|nr:hypothetical protein KUTeg_022341 [Tegillarca granosa]